MRGRLLSCVEIPLSPLSSPLLSRQRRRRDHARWRAPGPCPVVPPHLVGCVGRDRSAKRCFSPGVLDRLCKGVFSRRAGELARMGTEGGHVVGRLPTKRLGGGCPDVPRSCQRGGWTATGEGKGFGKSGHEGDLASMDVVAALDVWERWTAPNGGCVLRVLWGYGEPVVGARGGGV